MILAKWKKLEQNETELSCARNCPQFKDVQAAKIFNMEGLYAIMVLIQYLCIMSGVFQEGKITSVKPGR